MTFGMTLVGIWSGVLWNPVGPELVKKLLLLFGTRRFNAVFTRAHHLSLSLARPIQSMLFHPTS